MHVLLLTTAYKNKFNPVNSLFFYDQAKALSNYGFKVGVICSMPITFSNILRSRRFVFSDEFYDDDKIKTYVRPFLSIPKLRKRTAKIRFEEGKFLFKKYILDNGKPDVIHVHTFLAGEIAIWIKKNYKIPFIVTEHSSNFERNLFTKTNLNFAKKVFKNSSFNIAVSQQLANSINKQLNSFKFEIIPNVVDVSFFKPQSDQSRLYDFISVGRLDDNKNQCQLIEAFYKAFANDKKIKLLIVGDGPNKSNLQAKILEYNMSKQIFLNGYANRYDVLKFLQQSKYFVSTSKVETFGVVLIEAMSCGLPVLSTKSGGPESIVKNSMLGILCDLNDLEKEMLKILKSNYNSDYIRKYIVDNFSEKIISKKLHSIYFEITNR